jgi:hypothetical protein
MHVYLGLFMIAFSTLSLEITLVRLLSVTTWYHLSFFAVSTAMLGMTAGATSVYLHPRRFEGQAFSQSMVAACLQYALCVPVSLILLCLIPLSLYRTTMSFASLLVSTVICSLPFYFSGIVVSAVLTKQDLPMGGLYASDLLGASLGCLFVLFGLDLVDAPSLILFCGALGALGGLCFGGKKQSLPSRRWSIALFLCLGVLGVLNSRSHNGIRPVIVKGRDVEFQNIYELDRWNSFSRVAVYHEKPTAPQYWGPSPLAPKDPIHQRAMNIDGEAGTFMRRFHGLQDLDHLRYDLANIAYCLDRKGNACIIGVGGGRDVQSALLFGHDHVTGIEINPIFVRLLEKDYRDFTRLAGRPDVILVADEARSYLSRHPEKYSLIQMSLIDTWAATGAGAYSLSENCLYTVESWGIFFDRLEENGIFTVSRWNNPQYLETGRLLSLAVATLQSRGVTDPARHLAVVTGGYLATLILSRQPLTTEDLQKLTDTCRKLQFQILLAPNQSPREPLYKNIVSAKDPQALAAAVKNAELNISPPTDENPYYFNMLRLRHIPAAFMKTSEGIVNGNLIATLTLFGLMVILLIVALAAIVFPLLFRKSLGIAPHETSKVLWPGILYFSLIGAGFMLTEIALIQRLTVVLSHPIHALGILLFTLIASTGIGSWWSDKLPLTRKPWIYVYPLLTAASILGLRFLLGAVCPYLVVAPLPTRIGACVGLIFPLGILLGLFFPTGMRLGKSITKEDTPWYWALNGVFGVFCSALAVFISIYLGISINFYIAAGCYASVLVAQRMFLRHVALASLTS